jgi:hypothetical protein
MLARAWPRFARRKLDHRGEEVVHGVGELDLRDEWIRRSGRGSSFNDAKNRFNESEDSLMHVRNSISGNEKSTDRLAQPRRSPPKVTSTSSETRTYVSEPHSSTAEDAIMSVRKLSWVGTTA